MTGYGIFWVKANSKEVASGCWEWTGGLNSGGYGQTRILGVKRNAHRATWIVLNGAIPDHVHVLHKCDNRLCINPDHLWLGTNYDNVQDRKSKGRPGGRSAKLKALK